jgi:hypothetical protein
MRVLLFADIESESEANPQVHAVHAGAFVAVVALEKSCKKGVESGLEIARFPVALVLGNIGGPPVAFITS